ncbi:hypothetical protein [Thermoflexibacter ruber]|uniref:Uncharacterized protein n=1 Tax=Thermoflexibacter ruber TaxID=1003 RepID=A0A1I2K673_9BACT|nr:hypothetical protein [Thermoflexibacter ruber]SFF62414.1 hypothetical protein SAMN04488541_10892 [Thermoflexibacter ruber]
MKTVTISEVEYLQMQEHIKLLQQQLALLQDATFMQNLQSFIALYLQIQKSPITYLPITQAEIGKEGDSEETFGMWADRDITQESLRKQAWGTRI